VSRVVAVVGGGISGLGAARVLSGAAPVTVGMQERVGGARADLEVLVLESADRFGGKILSGEFRGRQIDFGPDNFLTRNQSAADLCELLGIGSELVAPATSSASVVSRGRLHPMPSGLILGLPPDLVALARSRIVSWRGLARAGLDLLPVGKTMSASSLGINRDADEVSRRSGGRDRWGAVVAPEWSAAAILERRLGRELVQRLVDPLLGGINAGGLDHLSLTVVAPQVAQALVGHRSVTRALQLMVANAPARPVPDGSKPRPFFIGVRGGLGRMVEELVADLRRRGVRLQTNMAVTALRRAGNRYALETPAGTVLADGVVLAAPGHVTARLLVDEAPSAATDLGSIPHSSVALVTISWPFEALASLPPGSGFLVPRCEGLLTTGCTFLSAKWPATAASGEAVIRVSTGRYGDERAMSMSDGELVDAVLGELRALCGVTAAPLGTWVQRWPQAFPQYLPGHLPKIGRAQTALAQLRAVEMAGPALGGIGIPACLTSGERAAVEVLDRLAP